MSAAIAIAGWSSAALLLGAYALLSMRKLESDGTAFQLLNGVGARDQRRRQRRVGVDRGEHPLDRHRPRGGGPPPAAHPPASHPRRHAPTHAMLKMPAVLSNSMGNLTHPGLVRPVNAGR
jgi:hypothetical protein